MLSFLLSDTTTRYLSVSMTSSGIPLTHRLGRKQMLRCEIVLRCATLCYVVLDEIFQSCNVVLLPVKSLRESVQLLPSNFDYSGPMDLTQVKNTFNQES